MIDSPPERRIDIDEHPELRDGLVLFGGEARFRHLYTSRRRRGRRPAAWTAPRRDADVMTRDEAIARGWFGAVIPTSPRLGDVVVAMHRGHLDPLHVDLPLRGELIGLHGSLTPVEMVIPVVVA